MPAMAQSADSQAVHEQWEGLSLTRQPDRCPASKVTASKNRQRPGGERPTIPTSINIQHAYRPSAPSSTQRRQLQTSADVPLSDQTKHQPATRSCRIEDKDLRNEELGHLSTHPSPDDVRTFRRAAPACVR